MSKSFHPFHIVNLRPWPIVASFGALSLIAGMILMFHKTLHTLVFIRIPLLLITSIIWWRDITRESTFQGHHTIRVTTGLKVGIILFIASEVFFFISFFWSFFHSSLSPTPEIGGVWPPTLILPFNPFIIPLLNTALLLSSGITLTWSHHRIIEKNLTQAEISLLITITLGVLFTFLQGFEYAEASFSISDSAYGSTFFMATGFHGLHVIIGTSFLLTCFLRLKNNHFSSYHHFGFEAAAWYWHFVDVVWLFLFVSLYWWGQ